MSLGISPTPPPPPGIAPVVQILALGYGSAMNRFPRALPHASQMSVLPSSRKFVLKWYHVHLKKKLFWVEKTLVTTKFFLVLGVSRPMFACPLFFPEEMNIIYSICYYSQGILSYMYNSGHFSLNLCKWMLHFGVWWRGNMDSAVPANSEPRAAFKSVA